MKFEKALQEATQGEQECLTEGFRRYQFTYKGSRPWYKIHDKHPFVLAIDDNYNVDKRGKSILGINMHYFEGSPDRRKLFKQINDYDDEGGYKGFDLKAIIDRDKATRKRSYDKKIKDMRIERYERFKKAFPMLMPYLRRYKFSAIEGIRRRRDDNNSDVWQSLIRAGHEGD